MQYFKDVFFIVSLIANAFLAYRLFKSPATLQKTTDAKDLIHDLTRRGQAVVKIEVLDPEGMFITRGGR